MTISDMECITNGCKNRVHLGYWKICIGCYSNTPNYIPTEQVQLYYELKSEKENNETSNDM